VVVLDNHPAHKTTTIRTLAKNLDLELLFLPPYKPEMNPIESLWSVIKHDLKLKLL
jgi:transposase